MSDNTITAGQLQPLVFRLLAGPIPHTNHRLVALVLLETLVRYCRLLDAGRVSQLVGVFLGSLGIGHPASSVCARAYYLFNRVVKALKEVLYWGGVHYGKCVFVYTHHQQHTPLHRICNRTCTPSSTNCNPNWQPWQHAHPPHPPIPPTVRSQWMIDYMAMKQQDNCSPLTMTRSNSRSNCCHWCCNHWAHGWQVIDEQSCSMCTRPSHACANALHCN